MSLQSIAILLLFLVLSVQTLSGQSDSTATKTTGQDSIEASADKVTFGSLFSGKPGKALLYSAILPGAGQAYNKKYWKVPIVYAAIGTSIYILNQNRQNFDRFDRAYRIRVDGDTTQSDEFEGILSLSQINNFRQAYRKDVQRTYIAMGLIYLIQAFEAYVDRHLMTFDIDEDLSIDLKIRLAPGKVGLLCNLTSGNSSPMPQKAPLFPLH